MKKIVLVSSFLLTISFQINAQWEWQNPLPQGNDLNEVSFIDTCTGWFVGRYGTILKTTDKGNSWTFQSSGTKNDLQSVFFIDSNNGIAVGNNGRVMVSKYHKPHIYMI